MSAGAIELPTTVLLTEVATAAPVQASIVRLTRDSAKKQIDAAWWQLPGVSGDARKNENDHSWQWAKRLGELKNDKWWEALAVEIPTGYLQGAILYRIDARSFADGQSPAVSIEALATAPRNRPWLVEEPLYRGVGEGLLLRAVCHSYALAFQGRVTLEVFDDERTLEFYRNRGFEVVGQDEDLPLLEMSPVTAIDWLREEG